MNRDTILLIEDDKTTSELIQDALQRVSYNVLHAGSAEEGLKQLSKQNVDLLILDLTLPDRDGLEVFKALQKRKETASIPVIMLTARDDEADVVSGLELGAYDYITKPFSPRILVARVKTVLRRSRTETIPEGDPIQIGSLSIHPGRHEIQLNGSVVPLTFTEFKILHLLAMKPGWVFTRKQIVEATSGNADENVSERSVDVLIVGLRKKLGNDDSIIETVRGVGYRMKEAEDD